MSVTVTAVRERPILFSGQMVRAILDGKKTQTRRVILRRTKDQGECVTARPDRGYTPESIRNQYPCPYGEVGDRLWVRETWAMVNEGSPDPFVVYAADRAACNVWDEPATPRLSGSIYWVGSTFEPTDRWRPSIHMPRWASRLTLEITGVRVERVQHIIEWDAKAEGVGTDTSEFAGYTPHKSAFAHLWQQLNGPRGYGWDQNPWVWVVEFQRVEPQVPA